MVRLNFPRILMHSAAALFLGSIVACAGQSDPTWTGKSLPSVPPTFQVKWDISQKDNQLVQDFLVTKYNAYHFYIKFIPIRIPLSSEELEEYNKFLGDGAIQIWTNDPVNSHIVRVDSGIDEHIIQMVQSGKYIKKLAHPGTVIPVHLEIDKVNDNDSLSKIVDQEIDTGGTVGGVGVGRGLSREIAFAKLKPGKYRVSINTTKSTKLPVNVKTNLLVQALPWAKALKDNE